MAWHDSADKLPVLLNPVSGEIVTANNEVDRQWPYEITGDWVAPFRAERIRSLLGNSQGLDVAAMARLQADITSVSADRILKAVAGAREKARPNQPDAIAALDELRSWDRKVDERPTSLVYEAFEEALWRRTFADEMPSALYDRFYRYAANERFAGLHSIIDDADSPWFDDRGTSEVRETRDDVVNLRASRGDACRRCGPALETGRNGGGTRSTPSRFHMCWLEAEDCWSGSSAGVPCR